MPLKQVVPLWQKTPAEGSHEPPLAAIVDPGGFWQRLAVQTYAESQGVESSQ